MATLIGSNGVDTLTGGSGDDYLDGRGGADTLNGGAGYDWATYLSSGAAVTIDLAAGTGTGGNAAGDVLISIEAVEGSAYADILYGNSGVNVLLGNAGNDAIAGGMGADTIDGGTGIDTASYGNSTVAVYVNLSTGVASGGEAEGDTLISIENLYGSNSYDDTLIGDAGVNFIRGAGGDDTLEGGAGADTLDGGAGIDRASYAGSASGVWVDIGTGTGSGGDAEGDILSNIEQLEGSAHSDRLNGDSNGNLLLGGDGDDFLFGRGGADTLDGGAGLDHATYITSSAAVTINLATGTGSGGDASGDVLISIELVQGSAYGDTLIGDSNANVFNGGKGNDTLNGGLGADCASYTDSTGPILVDLANGSADDGYGNTDQLTSIEDVWGSANNDIIYGDSGVNVVLGNAGNDAIAGGTGADTIDGGIGIDTASYGNSSAAVYVNLSTGVATGGEAEGDTLISIENLYGSNSYDDTLIGDAGVNHIRAAGGNDTLEGGAGADTLDGGTGIDRASYAGSASGVIINLATGIVSGGDANGDTLVSIEDVEGTAFDDQLTGNSQDNLLLGGGGNDTLDGGAGADSLSGGLGNDLYIVDSAGDMVVESTGQGTDEVRTALAAHTLADNVEILTYTGSGTFAGTGNSSANTITGGAGTDSLAGGGGNDTLDGGAGADTLVGGTGNDTFLIDNVGDVVSELSGEGTDTVRTGLSSYTLGANVENLAYTGSGPFSGTGNALNNSLGGGSAADLLVGLDGNDTLNGGAGADTLIGGAGNDVYVVDNALDTLVELPGEGTDTVQSSISLTLLDHFENLTLTGGGSNTGTGNAVDNVLTGNGAANTLYGLDGNDTLNGGGGIDTLVGGTGNDSYVVDNSGDVITEAAGEGTDTVSASASYTLASAIESLTLTGSANINGTGNDLANTLTGNAGANTLDGGLGADIMTGGSGNDVYVVDDAGDVVTEASGQGVDEVRTTLAGFTLGANVENLTHIGTGPFSGIGNALDNRLVGGTAADTLDGGSGSDTLDGGLGADSLIGGAGDDVFLVDDAGDVVIELPGEGMDEVRTTLAAYTLGDDIERLAHTGSAAFVGTGNALDNRLQGGSGADTLDGGIGADTLDGGLGADSLIGGAGDDVYLVDDAGDVVIELLGEGFDEVRTSLTAYTLGAGLESLIHTGTGSFSASGNGLANILAGGSGNDTLDGGGGADTLIGGAGDDLYTVDDLGDIVTELSGGGTDTVLTDLNSWTLGADVENLIRFGSGDFAGTGNGLANQLQGASGNDTLDGGAGNDTLTGGLGADLFVFTPGSGLDAITDFNAGDGDMIGLASGQTYTVDTDLDGNAVIVSGTDLLTLIGVQPASVSAAWFITI